MATWIGAADGAPPAVGGRPTSVVTAISFHVVTGLPVAPWAAGVVVVMLLSTSAAAATAPIKIRLDFIASPSSSDEGATCPQPGLRVVSILTSQGLFWSRLQ